MVLVRALVVAFVLIASPVVAQQTNQFPMVPAAAGGGGSADVTDRAARLLGHVTVDNATIAVTQSGTWNIATLTTLTSITNPVAVTGTFWQVTQPVSGTFWQVTQPVSGSLGRSWTLASGTDSVTALGSGNFTVVQDTGTNLHVVVDTAPTTAVTGTFWQVTQPVSIASMPSTPVTGTFFQATQPISAVSLPLPSNAAQETGGNLAAILAKQPAPGTISAPSADVLTVYSYTNKGLPLQPCNAVRRTNCAPKGY